MTDQDREALKTQQSVTMRAEFDLWWKSRWSPLTAAHAYTYAWQAWMAARAQVAACETCNGAGSVGHPPDDYFDCPACTAQPAAPAVPEVCYHGPNWLTEAARNGYCAGWNECREAVLSAAPQPPAEPERAGMRPLSDEQWIDLASRHANADWNSEQPDGYLNAVKALVLDAVGITGEQP